MHSGCAAGRRVVLIAFFAASLSSCGEDSGTAPSPVITVPITSIVYQRERPADSPNQGALTAILNIPNNTDRSVLRSCLLRPTATDSFDCGNLVAFECPVGVQCPISVSDPAPGRDARSVARGLFINGQRLMRIDFHANGNETGQILFDRQGSLQ